MKNQNVLLTSPKKKPNRKMVSQGLKITNERAVKVAVELVRMQWSFWTSASKKQVEKKGRLEGERQTESSPWEWEVLPSYRWDLGSFGTESDLPIQQEHQVEGRGAWYRDVLSKVHLKCHPSQL